MIEELAKAQNCRLLWLWTYTYSLICQYMSSLPDSRGHLFQAGYLSLFAVRVFDLQLMVSFL